MNGMARSPDIWKIYERKKISLIYHTGKMAPKYWNSLGKRSVLHVCTYAHAHTYLYTQTHPLRFSEIFDNMMHLKNTYDFKLSKMFGT